MGFCKVLFSILKSAPFGVTGEFSLSGMAIPESESHKTPIPKTSQPVSYYLGKAAPSLPAQMFPQPEAASRLPGGLLALAFEGRAEVKSYSSFHLTC